MIVALHPEGVDRNEYKLLYLLLLLVALHPEGVDRNSHSAQIVAYVFPVALHPEGVDRNCFYGYGYVIAVSRPPPGGRG